MAPIPLVRRRLNLMGTTNLFTIKPLCQLNDGSKAKMNHAPNNQHETGYEYQQGQHSSYSTIPRKLIASGSRLCDCHTASIGACSHQDAPGPFVALERMKAVLQVRWNFRTDITLGVDTFGWDVPYDYPRFRVDTSLGW